MSAESVDQRQSTPQSPTNHYGRRAVRKSLRHFALGKGIKFVSTLASLLILARWLESSEYGAYIALRGFVEVARIVTTVGVSAVLFRYLPELRASGNNAAAFRLLKYGMLLRVAAVILILAIAQAYSQQLGITFNIEDWIWLIPIALLVGALDFAVVTLSQSLESFLWQKEAQFSLAAGNVFKTLLFVMLVITGELNLPYVIFVEGLGMVLSLVLLFVGLWKQWRADQDRAVGDVGWLRVNLKRMARFGAWAFGLNLSAALYGPGPNRLLVANQLPIGDLATFGFASSLAQFGRRMMPARLTSTMLRPLLVAKFAVSSDFSKVSQMSNLVIRLNLSLLLVPIGILLIAGEQVLDLATNGKYGPAAWLLVAFLVILTVEGTRQLLALAAQAVERNDLMMVSNLIQSASFLLAFPLIPVIGVWAVLTANFVGTVFANLTLVKLMKRAGFDFRMEWAPIGLLVVEAAVSTGLGLLVVGMTGRTMIGSALGVICFLASFLALYWKYPPFDREERILIRSVIGRKGKNRRGDGPPTNDDAAA